MTPHPNDAAAPGGYFVVVGQVAAAWLGWFFSNINAFVGVAALILTILQIFLLCRDKLGWFKKRRKEK